MRVLVAGATGTVGRLLVPQLLQAGHQVTGTSRSSAGVERVRGLGASAVQADALDRDSLRQAVATATPDAVIHQLSDLSAGTGGKTDELRMAGTRHLVDAAKAGGVNRIVVQSLAWAYAAGESPAEESAPLDVGAEPPRAAMVDGLLALEGTAAELDTAVSLRYGVLYGPGTWYEPGNVVSKALAGDPDAHFLGSLVPDDSVFSFVHIVDAVRATVAALDWPSGPVNIVDDEPAPAREWVPVLAAALGQPTPEPSTGKQSWARGASNRLARSRGWVPTHPTWRTGFADQRG
jgi:nucleoside-diphosphate-sugar epimerase